MNGGRSLTCTAAVNGGHCERGSLTCTAAVSGVLSFDYPVALLALAFVPLTALIYVSAQRRRRRFAVRFTNLDLLAGVVTETPSWRRHVPPLLFLLAVAALALAIARPHEIVNVAKRRATVMLVTDRRLDAGHRCEADAPCRCTRRRQELRPRDSGEGRPRLHHVQQRRPGSRPPDLRSQSRHGVAGHDPGARRDRDGSAIHDRAHVAEAGLEEERRGHEGQEDRAAGRDPAALGRQEDARLQSGGRWQRRRAS